MGVVYISIKIASVSPAKLYIGRRGIVWSYGVCVAITQNAVYSYRGSPIRPIVSYSSYNVVPLTVTSS